DANVPVPPLPPASNRTGAFCSCSICLAPSCTPYFFAMRSVGNWSMRHMPSSARSPAPASATAAANITVVFFTFRIVVISGEPERLALRELALSNQKQLVLTLQRPADLPVGADDRVFFLRHSHFLSSPLGDWRCRLQLDREPHARDHFRIAASRD